METHFSRRLSETIETLPNVSSVEIWKTLLLGVEDIKSAGKLT